MYVISIKIDTKSAHPTVKSAKKRLFWPSARPIAKNEKTRFFRKFCHFLEITEKSRFLEQKLKNFSIFWVFFHKKIVYAMHKIVEPSVVRKKPESLNARVSCTRMLKSFSTFLVFFLEKIIYAMQRIVKTPIFKRNSKSLNARVPSRDSLYQDLLI